MLDTDVFGLEDTNKREIFELKYSVKRCGSGIIFSLFLFSLIKSLRILLVEVEDGRKGMK